ncbi:hypothetical protein SAMN05443637_111125 [Pseudonocardia thermophila]|jgi:hypothetical protein|uniref:Uncharacterized protein n=1 Tax=Pseudonocardia thermophila TaxID=1848 RepID=A0A1M6V0U2_PSETH|nr:hypothetical protein [Pseudonocardia thermophila]SHK75014.1 hypothetical protein SAMN05443637_111125 [Pseudonocardia thermophila]
MTEPGRSARSARIALIGIELLAGVSAVGGIGLTAGNAIGMLAWPRRAGRASRTKPW